jgi:hypothetical protein
MSNSCVSSNETVCWTGSEAQAGQHDVVVTSEQMEPDLRWEQSHFGTEA